MFGVVAKLGITRSSMAQSFSFEINDSTTAGGLDRVLIGFE